MEEFIRIFCYPWRDETKKVNDKVMAAWSGVALAILIIGALK